MIRAVSSASCPRTRESLPEEGMGVAVFKNAVSFVRDELL